MANPVKVEITADAKGLLTELQKSTAGLKLFAKDVDALSSGMASMLKNVQAPLLALAGLVGGTAALKGAVSETKDWTVESMKLAKTLGITTEEASVLNLAIGDIYGSMDEFLPVVAKLTRTLNTDEDAFKKLGVATRDSNGHLRPTLEIMTEVNSRLMSMASGTDRNVASMRIYGKGWMEVQKYLGLTQEVMDEARSKAERLNLIVGADAVAATKAYRAASNDLEDTLKALSLRAGRELMPLITSFSNWAADTGPSALKALGSALDGLREILSMTTVQVGLLLLGLRSLGGASLLRSLTSLAGALKEVYSIMVVGTAGPMTAMASSVYAILNPVTLTIAAFAGMAVGLEWLNRAESRWHETRMQEFKDSTRQVGSLQSLQREYAELAKRLQSGKLSGDEKAQALKRLKTLQEELVAIAPEYRKILDNERDSYVTIAQAIKEANAQKKKDLESKLAQLEAELKLAEARAKRAAESDGGRFDKGPAEGETGAVIAMVEGVRKAEERVQHLKVEVDSARQALLKLNAESTKTGNRVGEGENKQERSSFEMEMLRIKADGLKLQERETLAQKEALAIEEARNHLAQEKAKWMKDKSINQEQYDKLVEAGEAKLAEKIRLIHEQTARERERINADTLRELEGQELDGIEKQIAAEREKWRKINEDRRKANLQAIGQEVLDAKISWMRLQNALTKGPRKFEWDGKGGLFEGLQEYLAKSENAFEKWKAVGLRVVEGVEGAFSQGFAGILSGQMNLAQGLQAIWQGLIGVVSQVLAQLAAQWLVGLITKKAVDKAAVVGDVGKITAAQGVYTAESFAAYAAIPFVGLELAMAQIAAMDAITIPKLGAALAANAYAQGGIIDRPTLALMGEVPGSREVVMPETTAKDWLTNLTANVLGSRRQVERYQAQGGSYAAQARGGVPAGGTTVVNVSLAGANIMDTSRVGMHRLGTLVMSSLQQVSRGRGVTLAPGAVLGGV